MKEQNKIDKLINFGEISRLLSGTRSVITRDRIPKKHLNKVNELRELVKKWYNGL